MTVSMYKILRLRLPIIDQYGRFNIFMWPWRVESSSLFFLSSLKSPWDPHLPVSTNQSPPKTKAAP